MSANFTKKQKYCATCEYWQGERKTDSPRVYSVLQTGSVQGKCIEKKITTPGASNSSCNKWVAWGILK